MGAGHTEATAKDKLPSFPDFCMNIPLYSTFPFNSNDMDNVRDFEFYKGYLDCYCLDCKQPSVFTSDITTVYGRAFVYYATKNNYVIEREFFCSRDQSHELFFYFRFHNRTVTKIGQNPSMADLAAYDIRKYSKVLGSERYAEFSRAVGLVSHGVGIGSFVYLRRIIEKLIEEAYQIESKSDSWNDEQYTRSRMVEKIIMLKDSLPEFLATNKSIYSILSKGIHELDEQECLNSFGIVRVAIELILDDKLEKLKREDKIKRAKSEISLLNKKLKQ